MHSSFPSKDGTSSQSLTFVQVTRVNKVKLTMLNMIAV